MTTPVTLPSLATPQDIRARLGRSLTDAEATRAEVLLADASAQIRRYCRKDFQYHPGDSITVKAVGADIRLPYRPVVRVQSVTAVAGNPAIPDIPVAWWTFDDIDTVSIAEATASGVINLPEAWLDFAMFPGSYTVVYDHGYTAVPYEVTMVAATAVIEVLLAPTMAAGVIGETVGSYSYRLERSGGGLAVALSEADLAALIDYRDKYGTVGLSG